MTSLSEQTSKFAITDSLDVGQRIKKCRVGGLVVYLQFGKDQIDARCVRPVRRRRRSLQLLGEFAHQLSRSPGSIVTVIVSGWPMSLSTPSSMITK